MKIMDSNTKLPQKYLYLILILCSIIIFSNCIEVMINVKDIDIYREWLNKLKELGETIAEDVDYYQLYVSANLSHFFIKILVPMILGIYSYFVFKRSKINKIFIYVWTVLLLGNLAFILIELKVDSIFFYINIICYIILIITLLSLNKFMDNKVN